MNKHTAQCHNCGGYFHQNAMADWTICFGCKQRETEKECGEPVFIDSLGITWTASELEEAGGKAEVMRMGREIDNRNNIKN